MKIFLTGSTGFVGKAILAQLTTKGYEVICGNRLKGYNEDLTGVDYCIHLAAKVHDFNEENYQVYYDSNVALTERLLKRSINSKVKKFIFLSTIKVNGEESQKPYSELKTKCPTDLYGKSKWEAERLVEAQCSNSSTSFTIIRPPLIFGPQVKANFLSLIKIALKPIPLPLGLVKEKRSFIFVENLGDIIMRCLHTTDSDNMTFLVRDDTDLSTQELVLLMRKELESSPLIFPLPLNFLKSILTLSGRKSLFPRIAKGLSIDDSKTRELLNWSPPVSTKTALKTTLESFKKKF